MTNIFCLICIILISLAVGVFLSFVVFNLGKLDTKLDNLPRHYWSMSIYMDDIPQTEQNTLYLNSIPLKIYERNEFLDPPVPRVGEEVGGIYHSGENRFEMTGIVERVFYNTSLNLIVVSCKCTDIRKVK